MKVKNLIKMANDMLDIIIYDINDESTLFKGTVKDVPYKYLDKKIIKQNPEDDWGGINVYSCDNENGVRIYYLIIFIEEF